jgi:hypothetical protein
MQPSIVLKHEELAKCRETIKTGTPEQKAEAKKRAKELEKELFPPSLEKASIATDEQID